MNVGGGLGTTTVWSNTAVTNNGTINGGIISTGAVVTAGNVIGPVSIQGGTLENDGTISTLQGNSFLVAPGVYITNSGTINLGSAVSSAGAPLDIPWTSVLVNMGQFNLWENRLTVEGSCYGTGTFQDPASGGGYFWRREISALVRVQAGGVMSPGAALTGVIGTMNLYTRLDWESDPKNSPIGFGTLRIDVDFSNPQTNDIFNCDRWNNDTGLLLMTNINPGAGSFANGQSFIIFNDTGARNNNSGIPTNSIDTAGFCPTIEPFIPGPGLVWGTTNFNLYGTLQVTTNTMIWDGSTTANWTTNIPGDLSWKGGVLYQDASGAFFGDNASGSTSVNLTNIVSPAGYTAPLVTNNASIFPGVVVSNATKNYVISGIGKISGPTTIYKTGPGTFTLLTTNDYIGDTILENGTLAVSNYLGNGSVLSLGISGSGQMLNTVLFEGGKLSYVGTTNCTLNQYMDFEQSGTIGVESPTNFLVESKAVLGLGSLTKTGPGNLILNGGNSILGGGVIVNGRNTGPQLWPMQSAPTI